MNLKSTIFKKDFIYVSPVFAGKTKVLSFTEQWSPINTAGKKQYGREFLVKLSNDPLSKVKPSNLPNMDIIKDKLNPDKTKFSIPANLNKDWTPGFVKPTTSKTGLNTKGGSRDSKAANKRAGPPTVINLTLNTNIELNKAENAWKPDALRKEPNTNEDPQLELERNIRSILNKLTPQKFDKLVKKFNELNIDSEDKLKAAIELIFEKAVDEPEFSVAYARMCEVLREKKVKTTEGPLDFRKLLIGRCQKEFERDYMEGFDRAKFEVELKAAETEEKRKELQHEFEEKERRARRRSLGNIRFIGELYNLKMLTDRIMHEIINKLIKQIDEESLECLCWLLNTIGKVLDQATQAKLSAPQSDESKAVVSYFIFFYIDTMLWWLSFIRWSLKITLNSWFLTSNFNTKSSSYLFSYLWYVFYSNWSHSSTTSTRWRPSLKRSLCHRESDSCFRMS